MSSLIKKLLNGFTNINSTKFSGEKETRMLKFKTNVPEIDFENMNLIKASEILQQIGNEPNLSANEFYAQLAVNNYPEEEYADVVLAAISIETMMSMMNSDIDDHCEPTVH